MPEGVRYWTINYLWQHPDPGAIDSVEWTLKNDDGYEMSQHAGYALEALARKGNARAVEVIKKNDSYWAQEDLRRLGIGNKIKN